MNRLYVCREYEDMYSEGFKIVRPLEEHNKIIYNQALNDFVKKYKEKTFMENKLVDDIAEQLKK